MSTIGGFPETEEVLRVDAAYVALTMDIFLLVLLCQG